MTSSKSANWLPLEWPDTWRAEQMTLLRETPFNAIVSRGKLPSEVAAAAQAAGVATPAIDWQPWKKADWAGQAECIGISDGFWPTYNWKGLSDGSAGPTGEPWLDANGWLYLYGRSRGAGRTVWLNSDPPADPRTVRQAHLHLLLAEAFAYGGRRPMWLPPLFAAAIVAGNSRAIDDWKSLGAKARWFEERDAWRSWTVVAPLLVLSDFSGDNEYVAGETMLLTARQQTAFWPVLAASVKTADFASRQAVLYLDNAGPEEKLLAMLRDFAAKGGLVLLGTAAGKAFADLKPAPGEAHARFDLFSLGSGRVAVAREAFADPWTLADDAHLLMSRRHDPARLYNGGLLHLHSAISPQGDRTMVHVVNYGTESPGHIVVLQVNRRVKSARVHLPGSPAASPVALGGTPAKPEIVLPDFSVYAAVELEQAHA
jgi:hypothetical protein